MHLAARQRQHAGIRQPQHLPIETPLGRQIGDDDPDIGGLFRQLRHDADPSIGAACAPPLFLFITCLVN
jgi:hypothetical protein